MCLFVCVLADARLSVWEYAFHQCKYSLTSDHQRAPAEAISIFVYHTRSCHVKMQSYVLVEVLVPQIFTVMPRATHLMTTNHMKVKYMYKYREVKLYLFTVFFFFFCFHFSVSFYLLCIFLWFTIISYALSCSFYSFQWL